MAAELAAHFGMLGVATWQGVPVWAVTDQSRRSCQFRRMDGLPFQVGSSSIKALTARGSEASWPIGIPEAHRREEIRTILLTEGSSDFLAAWHFVWSEEAEDRVQPVCMLGAGQRISADALPLFRGMTVRIIPDLDPAGDSAAYRWEKDLREAEADAHCFDLSGLVKPDGTAVKDLNDLVYLPQQQLATLGGITNFN